jgi:hypothetical protein
MTLTKTRFFLSRVVGVGALVSLLSVTVFAADADPNSFIGTWSINAAKSKATGDALPASYTSTFTDAGGGKTHTHAEWTEADGSKHIRDYTAAADGKAAPVTGDPSVDSVRITSQKPGQIHVKFSKGGKVVEWSHYSMSPDGNSVRGTESAKDDKGATVTYHVVFDRK